MLSFRHNVASLPPFGALNKLPSSVKTMDEEYDIIVLGTPPLPKANKRVPA